MTGATSPPWASQGLRTYFACLAWISAVVLMVGAPHCSVGAARVPRTLQPGPEARMLAAPCHLRQQMLLAIDQGTTGSTALVAHARGRDPREEDRGVPSVLPEAGLGGARRGARSGRASRTRCPARSTQRASRDAIAAVGITNQRETTVVWDGRPAAAHRAIVWQCRRTADECDRIKRRRRAARPQEDRPRHRRVLLRDEDRLAPRQRGGRARSGPTRASSRSAPSTRSS